MAARVRDEYDLLELAEARADGLVEDAVTRRVGTLKIEKTVNQIAAARARGACPACGRPLQFKSRSSPKSIIVGCSNSKCEYACTEYAGSALYRRFRDDDPLDGRRSNTLGRLPR